MSSALDLVVLNGPLEGEVVQLRPNEALLVGRSSKGLQLIDPLVSLNHCEITWQGDRYWVEDLKSATGTFVNDVRLLDKAVVLVPGMRIRLGETDIEVRERPRSALLRLAGAAAALFLLFIGVQTFMDSIEVEYEPFIRWYEPVRQGAGYESDVVEIPTEFIRTRGVDQRELQIEEVSDYDDNGVDELWLRWPAGREIVTYAPDGTWRTLASLDTDCRVKGRAISTGLPAECYAQDGRVATEVPEVCNDGSGARGFPDLDCAGATYRYGDDGYEVVESEGVYAWMPPTEVVKKDPGDKKSPSVTKVIEGPLQPFLFTLIRPANLAGFLAERGVVEPVHYLVCEEALPGARAQVLTESGEIVPLGVGCIGDLKLEGPTRFLDFADGVPQMFAFTGTGYKALLEDMTRYLSGGDDTLLMRPRDRAAYQEMSKPPTRRRGAIRMVFEGAERIFDPIASEGPLPKVRRQLVAHEFAEQPPGRAVTITIDGPGRYDLEGCGELEVEIEDWHCLFTKGCGESSTFATMHNVGCGPAPKVAMPFARGLHLYDDGIYRGGVAIESIDQDRQIDVLRMRFSYRVPE